MNATSNKIDKYYKILENVKCQSVCQKDNYIIYNGKITQRKADIFAYYVDEFSKTRSGEQLHIYINSEGGGVYAGDVMYDSIMRANKKITTVCFSGKNVMSAAIITMFSCKYRIARKTTSFLLHKPYISNDDYSFENIRLLKEIEYRLFATYVKLSSHSKKIGKKTRTLDHCRLNTKMFTRECMDSNNAFMRVKKVIKELKKIYNNEEYSTSHELERLGLVDFIIE